MEARHRGVCFLPTDDELFFHYLMPRLHREPLPDPNAVRDCDMYGGDPWKIFGKDRDEKSYVFTTLKKKNQSRVDRTAGSGTWKGEQSYKIKGSQGEVVGYKKLFTFKPKASSNVEADKSDNGHWIMYEYSKHPHNDTDCVLCVISNKNAEEASKKARRNLHGRVHLEEENRRVKKARLHIPSAASPPSTPATTRAQPAASPPFNADEVVVPQNIWSPTSLDFSGGANGGPLSAAGAAASVVDREWVDQLKNMEFSPLVKYLLFKNVMERAQALHARNDVRVESQPICRPPGGVPADYQKN